MPKALRRQDITFEHKDEALRNDVRMLGGLIGDLLKEQGGEQLFEYVEAARLQAIRRREGNELPGERLEDLIKDLDLSMAMEVIRAFSTYFQIVNTAEKVHRIRRRREYLQEVGQYQPGGLEEMLVRLKASGLDLQDLQDLLDGIRVEPVFAGELDQDAVAHELDDAPVMLGQPRLEQPFTGRLEAGDGTFLVRTYEPAVADHIGRKNSGEPTFHTLTPWESALCGQAPQDAKAGARQFSQQLQCKAFHLLARE